MEEFRLYAKKGGKVFVSSHSPDLLNGANLDEVFWLVKENGYTIIKRAKEDKMVTSLVNEGDLLGNLWKQNYFTGTGTQ